MSELLVPHYTCGCRGRYSERLKGFLKLILSHSSGIAKPTAIEKQRRSIDLTTEARMRDCIMRILAVCLSYHATESKGEQPGIPVSDNCNLKRI